MTESMTTYKPKSLVIYESPNKFKAFSSMFKDMDVSFCFTQGRIYDLPNDEYGIDSKMNVSLVPVNEDRETFLKNKIAQHELIYCLTDNDPEGEWIASHVKDMCDNSQLGFLRVRVSELTQKALYEALNSASSEIDDELLSKAVSRRVIDRVIGYFDNEERSIRRGRVLTPAISHIQQHQPKINETAILVDGSGATVELLGTKDAIEKTIKEVNQLGTSQITSDDGKAKPVELFNTIEYLKHESLFENRSPKEAFEEAQNLYEMGMVSYTRTENKRYEVLNGEHKGICAIGDDVENDDEAKTTGTALDIIKRRTRLHLHADRYDILEPRPSDMLHKICSQNKVKIVGILRVRKKLESVHSIPRPIFLQNGLSTSKKKVMAYRFPHSKQYTLLKVLDNLGLGTPSTFHTHVEKLNKLTNHKDNTLTLNSHGTRIALQTDELSNMLMKIENVQEINNVLSNNTLSIEQKNKKCLNVLRISDSNESDFKLDN